MKKLIIAASFAGIAIGGTTLVAAQDAGDGTETGAEGVEDTAMGAIVVREDLLETVTDEDGNPVQAVDENGDPIFDENGEQVNETVVTGFVQTVETPSGNIHTITKEDGSRAIVTHEFANKPERLARAEKPERPERLEKPERPEKPEKPERPDRPGRD